MARAPFQDLAHDDREHRELDEPARFVDTQVRGSFKLFVREYQVFEGVAACS